jgi:cytochrome c
MALPHRRLISAATASILMLPAALPAWSAADATRGATLYASKCGGCHALDENRYGPAHRGVFGRKAGSAPGYAYSAALSSSTIVWLEDTLDRWLADPEKLIPGQRMSVSVPSEDDRRDLIAYLRARARKQE